MAVVLDHTIVPVNDREQAVEAGLEKGSHNILFTSF